MSEGDRTCSDLQSHSPLYCHRLPSATHQSALCWLCTCCKYPKAPPFRDRVQLPSPTMWVPQELASKEQDISERTLCDSGGWAIEGDTDRPRALSFLEHPHWSLHHDVRSQAGRASHAGKTPQRSRSLSMSPGCVHFPSHPPGGGQICE